MAFHPRQCAPPLERLAALSEEEFRELFGGTPVWRARYTGFLRNVAVAMGNRALPQFRPALEKLAAIRRLDGRRARALGAGKTGR